MSESNVIKVSTLVKYLKRSVDKDPNLHGVYVEGEISNIRKPNSGHWYFSLKDDAANMSCVMFSNYNRNVDFAVEDGTKVIIKGDVAIYEAEGRLQIMVTDIKKSGVGDLYKQFEELKKKLEKEGLFDEDHKKELPEYPMTIALVTGNNTAAREDVLMMLDKRWPVAKIKEFHCTVQGNDAAPKIISALKKADASNSDVVLLVRGGGSIEDLWCFNDEALARYIYTMKTPIVTGVGHQIDYTLVDFVSDVRANTPTGAVEISTPDIDDVIDLIDSYQNDLIKYMETSIQDFILKQQYLNDHLEQFHHSLENIRLRFNTSYQKMIHAVRQTTSDNRNIVEQRRLLLANAMEKGLANKQYQLQQNIKLLDAYSPLKVMQRGYAIVTKDNKAVIDTKKLKVKDIVDIRLSKGTAKAEIKEVKHEQD